MADIAVGVQEKKTGKELYDYQHGAISKIFDKFETAPEDSL